MALVTADLESHLVAVDADSGRVLKRISTSPGPRSVECERLRTGPRRPYGVRQAQPRRRARLEVVAEIGGLREPRYTAMHPAEPLAYVSDSRRQSVVVVDLARHIIVGHAAVPGPARHLSLSPDGKLLWVALGSKAARIAILDAADPRRPGPPPLRCRRRSPRTTSSGRRVASTCG